MRRLAALLLPPAAPLLLLAAGAWAAPKPAPTCAATRDEAVNLARTRGKLIFLTVIVDDDGENRAVIDQVFRNKEFLKIAPEFVCVYANWQDQHGKTKVKSPDGKTTILRCADCPSITCQDHKTLALNWARGFFPSSDARTPVHFIINAHEEVLDTIINGSFEQGLNHVDAGEVVTRLKAALEKHGRGLTEEEYKQMEGLLVDAKAARARGLVTLELEKLLPVVALDKDVEGVRGARTRVAEIDRDAAKLLEEAEVLVASGKVEEALDALGKVAATYPGTLSAAAAEKDAKDLESRPEVKRLLKARDLYRDGLALKEKGKEDLARKKFEACARIYGDTKYGELAAKE